MTNDLTTTFNIGEIDFRAFKCLCRLCSKKLTANVNLHFADICIVCGRKLHDEVSVRRHAGGTPQVSMDATQVWLVINAGVTRYTAW